LFVPQPRGASPSSHSSFCEEVFSRVALQTVGGHRPPLQRAGTNELDRTNILAPGFWSRVCGTHLLPAFTPEKFRGLAHGKSYPVTAAQLLPNCTGFLASIHFFKLAKNWINNYLLALGGSRFIYQS